MVWSIMMTVGFAYFKGHLKNKTNCNLFNIPHKNIKSFFASTVNLCENQDNTKSSQLQK